MKKPFFSRPAFILASSLLFLTVLVSSCSKDNDDIEPIPVAGLMAFNLVPDQPAISIGLSGNLLPGGPLAYPAYSGRYLNIFPGNRLVESVNATNGQGLDSVTYNFQSGKYYSLFVIGSGTNYRNVIAEDNYDSLTAGSGKAYVRYINALPNADQSTVVIRANGSDVVNTSADFGTVSSFTAVNPGEVTVQVSNEGAANNSRTITLQQQRAYTVLLTGLPDQTDTSKAVQIRYIENGRVTD